MFPTLLVARLCLLVLVADDSLPPHLRPFPTPEEVKAARDKFNREFDLQMQQDTSRPWNRPRAPSDLALPSPQPTQQQKSD